MVEAKGPTAEKVDGDRVTFAPLAKLEANGEASIRLRLRPERAGAARLQVEVVTQRTGPDRPVRVEDHIAVLEPARGP